MTTPLYRIADADGNIISGPMDAAALAAFVQTLDRCPTCVQYAGRMAPSHDGSKRCRSGSIASGGTRSHCSCDTCF